jgi:Ni,Fe-hydrogenase I cytochrome b subunit
MIATGFAIYSASARTDSVMRVFTLLIPFIGGLQTAHLVHHVTMWIVAGFALCAAPCDSPHTPV